ncbi:MAG: type III-A CRISPR-associated protein Cas10/Csm1 [Flavobacteriales bacterium]|nr:type III-A CRISPR-associated protein Cas10/Csm1 [Flavobacteriales bacterium]
MSGQQSYIIGDLSGLQDHLFDIPSKGAARRLRARSFRITLTAEAAALRVLHSLEWGREQMVLSAAGKFILRGPALDEAQRQSLEQLAIALQRGQFMATNGTLRFSLVVLDRETDVRPADVYDQLQRALQQEKMRPANRFLVGPTGWRSGSMPALEPACAVCQRRPGTIADAAKQLVCAPCAEELRIGSELPHAAWALLIDGAEMEEGLAGYRLAFSHEPSPVTKADHAYTLDNRNGTGALAWARHVPMDAQGRPLDFEALAAKAAGMPALGILKADGDSMGAHMNQLLQQSGWEGIRTLSKQLADQFSTGLDTLLNQPAWKDIYVVFAGGDDMLLVGPWDRILRFAGVFRNAFHERFGAVGLTLSAGVAVVKPRHPIAAAVALADEALDRAKTEAAIGAILPKDQIAAFGQVWKWKDHNAVLDHAERLARWVSAGTMPRGWLHRFNGLMQDHLADTGGLATAHMAYHIGRNLPKANAPGEDGEMRRWAESLLSDLKTMHDPLTRCAPAILQHAITATRPATSQNP